MTKFFLRKHKSSYLCSSSLRCKSSCNRVCRKDSCKKWGWFETISGLSFKFFIKFSVYNNSFPDKWTIQSCSHDLLFACSSFYFDTLCPWFKEVCVLDPLPSLLIASTFSGIVFSNQRHLRKTKLSKKSGVWYTEEFFRNVYVKLRCH